MFDSMIEIVWTLSWIIALLISFEVLTEVQNDWDAVVIKNIKNGRRIIAKEKLIIAILLVSTCFVNIIPGALSVISPTIIPRDETLRTINICCLMISAYLTIGIAITKKISRNKWNKEYKEKTYEG